MSYAGIVRARDCGWRVQHGWLVRGGVSAEERRSASSLDTRARDKRVVPAKLPFLARSVDSGESALHLDSF